MDFIISKNSNMIAREHEGNTKINIENEKGMKICKQIRRFPQFCFIFPFTLFNAIEKKVIQDCELQK